MSYVHIPSFPSLLISLWFPFLTGHTYLWFRSCHVCVMDTLIVDKMDKILQILSCDVLKFSEFLTAFHSFMLAPPVFVLTRCWRYNHPQLAPALSAAAVCVLYTTRVWFGGNSNKENNIIILGFFWLRQECSRKSLRDSSRERAQERAYERALRKTLKRALKRARV